MSYDIPTVASSTFRRETTDVFDIYNILASLKNRDTRIGPVEYSELYIKDDTLNPNRITGVKVFTSDANITRLIETELTYNAVGQRIMEDSYYYEPGHDKPFAHLIIENEYNATGIISKRRRIA